jgi:hypothetical protein
MPQSATDIPSDRIGGTAATSRGGPGATGGSGRGGFDTVRGNIGSCFRAFIADLGFTGMVLLPCRPGVWIRSGDEVPSGLLLFLDPLRPNQPVCRSLAVSRLLCRR